MNAPLPTSGPCTIEDLTFAPDATSPSPTVQASTVALFNAVLHRDVEQVRAALAQGARLDAWVRRSQHPGTFNRPTDKDLPPPSHDAAYRTPLGLAVWTMDHHPDGSLIDPRSARPADRGTVDAMVQQDLGPLRPSIFRLGHRLANLDQNDSSLFARNHVAQSAGKSRGFNDEYKTVMINGLAGYSEAPSLDLSRQPRTFQDLDRNLLAKTASSDATPVAAVAPSLSGNPMAVAVAAANGRTVTPVLERTIGAASTPEQQDWRDRYVYALPHAWVNFAGDALHSSRSGQENARRWRHATENLSPEQATLALQGVKLLSAGDANAWHDVWSVHREAAVEPARAPSTPAGPGAR